MFSDPHIDEMSAKVQCLEEALAQRETDIQSLQAENLRLREALKKPDTVDSSQQTDATNLNSLIFITKAARKPRKDLNKNQRSNRNVENKAAFTKLAHIIEGGDQRDDVQRVWVSIEFNDGTDYSFYAKGSEKMDGVGGSNDDASLAALHKVLEVKLRHRISYSALHELRMAGVAAIPPSVDLSAEFNRLATCLHIFNPPHAQLNGCSRRLSDILELVLQRSTFSWVLERGEVLLRFACDGAKITKNKHSVRATVRIMADKRDALTPKCVKLSPEDEFTLLFYMGKEDRTTLEMWSEHIFSELKETAEHGLNILGRHLSVKWILCSDWKALQLFRGINQANSYYFCLWCECTKDQISDFSVPNWPITRSADRQRQCLDARGVDGKRGYAKHDLLPWIPFSHMVPDELHLRWVVKWSLEVGTRKELLAEMKRIHVDFRLYEETGDDGVGKVHKWTQSGGDELDKILTNLNLLVWNDFSKLMTALKALPGTENYMKPEQFQEAARRWANDFRKATDSRAVIPYIHCLVYHVPQALSRFHYLPDIGISQVERKNYDHHLTYFAGTSREGGTFSKSVSRQILERENVLMHFDLTRSTDPKRGRKRRRMIPL
ncbi:hypothetical protein BaRGS_00007710, partial [Batillaria attramentaria]